MKCKCGRFDSKESTFHHHDGDHDESDCMERQGLKTVGHNVLANQVVKFMKECGWQSHVKLEVQRWDVNRARGASTSNRVPDITAVHPVTGKEYVLDCRISWNIMSDTAGGGFGAYKENGCFAAAGEKIKRKSWRDAVNERRINAPAGVEFVPFSIEVSGVWGPAARGFFRESIAMAHSARDIDLYHWSNQRLSDSWKSTFGVTIAVAAGSGVCGSR